MKELDNMNRASLDSAMCWIIGRMEIRLFAAKKKNPDGDYREQERIIKWLKAYELATLTSWSDLNAIERLYRTELLKNETLVAKYKQAVIDLEVYKEGL